MQQIQQNLTALQQRIADACAACGRDVGDITLIGVSKTKPAADVHAAAALGITDLGENYLDEAISKISACAALNLTWHYIGRIQSNKTQAIAVNFQWVHTLERAKIAQRLAQQCPPDKSINVLLQINVDRDPAKAGVAPEDAGALLEAIQAYPRLRPRGLMTILATDSNPRASYESVAQLADSLAPRLEPAARNDWNALSMGMTGDLEHAIAAGATHIRIGTALFGARQTAL